jgi:hypothetical protein
MPSKSGMPRSRSPGVKTNKALNALYVMRSSNQVMTTNLRKIANRLLRNLKKK